MKNQYEYVNELLEKYRELTEECSCKIIVKNKFIPPFNIRDRL